MSLSTRLQGIKEILKFDNRVEIIVHHLLRRTSDLCVYRFHPFQVVMLKSGGDLNGMRACLATDQYTQFFRIMRLSGPLRVIDLGAHTGGFIFTLLRYGHMIAAAVSVEQNRATHSRLAFNYALNRLDQCQALNAAVWSESVTLAPSDGQGLTSGQVSESSADEHVSETIRGYTLNELLMRLEGEANIDVCKIDVEGAEWGILTHDSGINLLSERCRYLLSLIHI